MQTVRKKKAAGHTSRPKREGLGDRQAILDHVGTVVKYILLVILLMYFVSLAHKAYDIGYAVFSQTAADVPENAVKVQIEIKEGMSVSQVAKLLKESGIIRDADIFRYQERVSSYHGMISPGVYTLSSDMKPEEILEVLAQNYDNGEDEDG